MDQNIKIHASARIDSAIDNNLSMYVISFDVHPTIAISNPVIFISGILIRLKYLHSILDCKDDDRIGIKLFIHEDSLQTMCCT